MNYGIGDEFRLHLNGNNFKKWHYSGFIIITNDILLMYGEYDIGINLRSYRTLEMGREWIKI